uniref:Uncharacterized protein n=1 Tax=Arundo donax TaxID=35708 RepID=A0A0A9FVU9_ARUDO
MLNQVVFKIAMHFLISNIYFCLKDIGKFMNWSMSIAGQWCG